MSTKLIGIVHSPTTAYSRPKLIVSIESGSNLNDAHVFTYVSKPSQLSFRVTAAELDSFDSHILNSV